jgi:proline dehydrogenase
VRTEAVARAAAENYVQALQRIAAERLDANVSLKLTQMGLDVSPDLCRENVRRVLECARSLNETFVRIDMESSAYTDRTLDLFESLWNDGFSNVGVVLQAYLWRTPDDLERVLRLGARVRLCKGAYLEPPEVAIQEKAEVDRQYEVLMERLLLEGTYPALATHDERLIRAAQKFARRQRLGPERFEFQMLLGVRRDLQVGLARAGYNVRVYTPYGSQWYPYLVRRLAERPANLAFVLRSLVREATARRP